jgi:hypothetical protein
MTFFFWNFIESNNYVAGVINAGNVTFRGNEFEIVGYFMVNSSPYLFYAIVTGVLGWVLIKLRHRRHTEIHETSVTPTVTTETIITRTEKE